ncbi:hypothetical protein H5410_065027 [Solanum commersonii]|uniref:Uncharacterized protein n=1 Tax=Solanum commersonii TaxID=4109 RepID=A0A9J5VXQ4_SOLCO|nr:hypothetical protein H5410_065027 [Solanum commersonii]
MNFIIIKARKTTYNKSFKDKIYFKRIINQILEKTSILCHSNVETDRQGKPFRGVNKVEALIRRKYPLKYDASSDRKI